MLSFEEKKEIFRSFKLKEKKISNDRINYVYPKSKQRGQVLATQLNPSGNGYVVGKYMSEETINDHKYEVDSRGWISIKEFSEPELTTIISEAMKSMSGLIEKSEVKPEPENTENSIKATAQNETKSEKIDNSLENSTLAEDKASEVYVTSEEITSKEKTSIEREEPQEKVQTSVDNKLPRKKEYAVKAEIKKVEVKPATFETPIGIMLNNFLEMNVLWAELGLTVWRKSAQRFIKM